MWKRRERIAVKDRLSVTNALHRGDCPIGFLGERSGDSKGTLYLKNT